MTQGPPCPNCGDLLRWYPDQQQWGCDKCRVMYPPQVMVQPQAYASRALNIGNKKRTAHGRVLTWNKPVIFGLLGLLLVGGGLAAFFLFVHKSKPAAATGGYPDRDTAVRETFAKISSGSLDDLMAHSGVGLGKTIVTCDEGKSVGDEAKDAELLHTQLGGAIERAKGATYKVNAVSEDKATTLKKGESLVRGCTLVTDYVQTRVVAKLEVTRNGKASAIDAHLDLAMVDGRVYVMTSPTFGGCDGAAAWTTLIAGRETDVALANKLGVPILTACTDDQWPAAVIECAANAVGIKDEHACLKDLDAAQRAHLAAAISGVLDQTPASATLRAMMPADADAPPKPGAVTNGTPVQAGVADFWVTPRSDGSFLVSSPLVRATFPTKPEIKVAPASKPNADGKTFDIYTMSAPPYELNVLSMGRNVRDTGSLHNLEIEVGKAGKVVKTERSEEGMPVTRLAVADKVVLDGRVDLVHGLIVYSIANGPQTAATAAYLASIHVTIPPDPVDDPDALSGVRQRKGAKTKLIVHDPDDHFTFEIPFNAKVERKVDTDAHAVTVAIKKKNVVVTISEIAAWDALAIGPTKLAELSAKAKPKAHLVWNAFQHRLFRVVCGAEAPCDPIVKSFHFADPEPPKP